MNSATNNTATETKKVTMADLAMQFESRGDYMSAAVCWDVESEKQWKLGNDNVAFTCCTRSMVLASRVASYDRAQQVKSRTK